MTQKEKQLLLVDLSARLPYCVEAQVSNNIDGETKYLVVNKELTFDDVNSFINNDVVCDIKPYLRPMSSMTEEEKQMMDNLWKDNNKLVFADPDEIRRYRFYDISIVDFLNSCHFDYRGLIEKGLAIEAPEDMYNTKTE